MKKIALLILLFFNLLLANNVYLKTHQLDNKLLVYLHNDSYHHVTIKYNAETKRLLPLGKLPFTSSYEPKSKNKIFEFLILDKKYSYKGSYRWALGTLNANHNNSYIYKFPFKTGTTHLVSQGYNGSFSHKGNSKYAIDFAMKENTKIFAARQGVVAKIKDNSRYGGTSKTNLNKANFIIIKHDDNTYAVYNHLKYKGVKVKEGEFVKRGEFIGLSGNTGYTNGPHLHFIVYKLLSETKRQSFPLKFLDQRGVINHIKQGNYYKASN